MNAIIEQIREAHQAAHNVFEILSDVVEQLKGSNNIDDELEDSVVELADIADNLQASLFDLLENNKPE